MAIAATAWIGRDLSQLAAQPVVFGLAYLAFALAVAIRFGAIPFHVWAARLTDAVPEAALPIVTAWGPAAFAVVALAWTDNSVAPLLVEMDTERAIILAIGVASIVLAAFAAWIQDDLEHVVGYSIIGDAGVVLLAIAALEPAAWAPARDLDPRLRGGAERLRGLGRARSGRRWDRPHPGAARMGAARTGPGVAFGVIVVAGIGLPGLAAFEARWDLVDTRARGRRPRPSCSSATLAPLAYYGRLLFVGLSRPDRRRRRGAVRRPAAGEPRSTSTTCAARSRTFWAANRAASSIAVASLDGAARSDRVGRRP